MEAESPAIWKALGYYIEKKRNNIILEVDTLDLKNMILGEWRNPCELIQGIKETK